MHFEPTSFVSQEAIVAGAPERVSEMCSFIQQNDGVVPFDVEQRRLFNVAADDMARKGMRVLAFAHELLPCTE